MRWPHLQAPRLLGRAPHGRRPRRARHVPRQGEGRRPVARRAPDQEGNREVPGRRLIAFADVLTVALPHPGGDLCSYTFPSRAGTSSSSPDVSRPHPRRRARDPRHAPHRKRRRCRARSGDGRGSDRALRERHGGTLPVDADGHPRASRTGPGPARLRCSPGLPRGPALPAAPDNTPRPHCGQTCRPAPTARPSSPLPPARGPPAA